MSPKCSIFSMRLCLVLVLVSFLIVQNADQSFGMKKKMIKKLKKVLPLLLAIKPKKKLLILPLPFPMMMKGSKFGGGSGGMSWGGGSSGGGMSWGSGMSSGMPSMSAMSYMPVQQIAMPSYGGMDNSWMMMSSMDCNSNDFYGMGGTSSGYTSGGYSSGKQVHGGGTSGYIGSISSGSNANGGGWNDNSRGNNYKENYSSGSGSNYQQGSSGDSWNNNNVQRPISGY